MAICTLCNINIIEINNLELINNIVPSMLPVLLHPECFEKISANNDWVSDLKNSLSSVSYEINDALWLLREKTK